MTEKIPIDRIKVISPMFSYGNGQLEPRSTELKGLIRNTYRISNPELDVQTLYKQEVNLFGGQLKEDREVTIKASPLRIQMLEQTTGSDIDKLKLRLHHKQEWLENGKWQKNYPYPMYNTGKLFEVNLSINYNSSDFSTILVLRDKKPLQWYTDLFNLSLILGGIGKRSRRGRGCMTTAELLNISKNDLPSYVVNLLNNVCGKEIYTVCDKRVTLKSSAIKVNNRPYIKEIRFGNTLIQATRQDVNEYLKKVDQASHEIEDKYGNYKATGFAKGENRFASSAIVSLAEIKEGIVPVYTLLHAVCKNGKFNRYHNAAEEQYAFVDIIEEGSKK